MSDSAFLAARRGAVPPGALRPPLLYLRRNSLPFGDTRTTTGRTRKLCPRDCNSQDGKHRERADAKRKEHNRKHGKNRPDTIVRVLAHQRPVAADSHGEDEDG